MSQCLSSPKCYLCDNKFRMTSLTSVKHSHLYPAMTDDRQVISLTKTFVFECLTTSTASRGVIGMATIGGKTKHPSHHRLPFKSVRLTTEHSCFPHHVMTELMRHRLLDVIIVVPSGKFKVDSEEHPIETRTELTGTGTFQVPFDFNLGEVEPFGLRNFIATIKGTRDPLHGLGVSFILITIDRWGSVSWFVVDRFRNDDSNPLVNKVTDKGCVDSLNRHA